MITRNVVIFATILKLSATSPFDSCVSVEVFQKNFAKRISDDFDIMDLMKPGRKTQELRKHSNDVVRLLVEKPATSTPKGRDKHNQSIGSNNYKGAGDESSQKDRIGQNAINEGNLNSRVNTESINPNKLSGQAAFSNSNGTSHSQQLNNDDSYKPFTMNTIVSEADLDKDSLSTYSHVKAASSVVLNQSMQMSHADYKEKGSGNMSSTYLISFKNSKAEERDAFVKIVSTDMKFNNAAEVELAVLQSISKANPFYLVNYFGCVVDKINGEPSNVAIFEEAMSQSLDKQNLLELQIRYGFSDDSSSVVLQNTDTKDQLEVAYMMLAATKRLHDSKIIHCDIKPANFVLKLEPVPLVKLIDFGLSIDLGPYLKGNKKFDKEILGTPYYYDPKLVTIGLEHKPEFKHDVFSLGLTLIYVFHGKNRVETGHFTEVKSIFDQTSFSHANQGRYDSLKEFLMDKNQLIQYFQDPHTKDELLEGIKTIIDESNTVQSYIDVLNAVMLGMIAQDLDKRLSLDEAYNFITQLLQKAYPSSLYLPDKKGYLQEKIGSIDDSNIFYVEDRSQSSKTSTKGTKFGENKGTAIKQDKSSLDHNAASSANKANYKGMTYLQTLNGSSSHHLKFDVAKQYDHHKSFFQPVLPTKRGAKANQLKPVREAKCIFLSKKDMRQKGRSNDSFKNNPTSQVTNSSSKQALHPKKFEFQFQTPKSQNNRQKMGNKII